MKQIVVILLSLIMTLPLVGQNLPDWVRASNMEGGLYVGKSLPTKEHPVERHIIALYDAMASYALDNQKDNHSEGFRNSQKILSNGNSLTMSLMRKESSMSLSV